jgi:pSer/pThr/pTyr-binding forkhead associated (FHA) protein
VAVLLTEDRTALPIPADEVIVGRHSADGIYVPDVDLANLAGGRTVSRRHARIYQREGQWYVVAENAATNQTYVNGREARTGEAIALIDGDALRFGRVDLVFRLADSGATLAPAQSTDPGATMARAADLDAGATLARGPAADPGATVARHGETPAANLDATVVRAVGAPAELRAGDRTYPLNAPEGRYLRLGRHTEDFSYRPEVDLGDLPGGRTVSREHGQFFRRGATWFLKVEGDSLNPTLLDDKVLEVGSEVELPDGGKLQFGRVVATFHLKPRIEAAGVEQIDLQIDPIAIGVEPGQQVTLGVTVVNHTGRVDWFRIELEGIPTEWYKVYLPNGTQASPALVRLFHSPPHTSPAHDSVAQLRIVIAPPRDCQSRAGVHPIAVSATTEGDPPQRRVVPSQLTVAPFEDLLFEIQPAEIEGRGGRLLIELENEGNHPALLLLATPEDAPKLPPPKKEEPATAGDRLAVGAAKVAKPPTPPKPNAQQLGSRLGGASTLVYRWDQLEVLEGMPLAACQRTEVGVLVRVKRRHWIGPPKRYPITINARLDRLQRVQTGALICPPWIPVWLQNLVVQLFSLVRPVLMIVAMLAVLLGAYLLLLRPPDVKSFKSDPATIVAGQPATLTWTIDRATRVTIDPSSGGETFDPKSGKLTIHPSTTTTYSLTAYNAIGLIPAHQTSTVEVQPAPPVPKVDRFDAQPLHIPKEGSEVVLSWQTEGVQSVTVSPPDEVSNPQTIGQATVHPQTKTSVYQLVATPLDPNQPPIARTVQVTIDPPTIASFLASATNAVQGTSVQLHWSAQNASKLTLSASAGNVATNQQQVQLPADATQYVIHPDQPGDITYTLTATNAGGSTVQTATVTVAPFVIQFFKAEPPSIAKGQTSTLSWGAPTAQSITLNPGGAVAPGETSQVVTPELSTGYTLTAISADGTITATKQLSVTVGVAPVKIDFFTAAPATVTAGQPVTMTFGVENAKTVAIQGSDGKLVKSIDVNTPVFQGSIAVNPTGPITYILTAVNEANQVSQPLVVNVSAPTPTPPTPTPAPAAVRPEGAPGGPTPTPTPHH